ncbi:MAG: hypothetical protein ACRDPJ_10825 [Nocardioidaceae bacterium]
MSRNAVSAALAVVVAFGVTSPAIAATNAHAGSGHTRAGHAKAHHVAKSHKGSAKEVRAARSKAEKPGHKTDKADGHQAKVDHRLANAQRKVTKEAVRKDGKLARVLRRDALSRLDASTADAVRANVAADRGLLDGYKAVAASAATLDGLKDVAKQVRSVRPEVYNTIVNQLAFAARKQAKVAENATALAGLGAEESAADVAAATAANDAAAAALTSAVAKYVTFTATTSRADLNAAKKELSEAGRLLGQVTDELEPEPAPADPVV